MLALLTDPVLGSWRRDVDDVLAIIMAKRLLTKIATTEGNGNAITTFRTALKVKTKLNINATVHPSPKVGIFSNPLNSVEALREAIRESIDIVSIAPNTYLYEAIKNEKPKYQNLVLMGGSLKKRVLGILPEFNFWKDPLAAERTIESPGWRRVIIVPVDTTISAKISCKKIFNLLKKGKTYDWLIRGIKPWCKTSTILFRGFIPHDLVAILAYKCLINKTYECDNITTKEVYIKLKKYIILKDSNGTRVEILLPSTNLAKLVLEDLEYSLYN